MGTIQLADLQFGEKLRIEQAIVTHYRPFCKICGRYLSLESNPNYIVVWTILEAHALIDHNIQISRSWDK